MENKWIKLFEEKFKKEADPNDIFGAYLFADQRKGMRKLEPNNDKEDKFFQALCSHYYKDGNLDKWIPKMRELKNDKKYKDFLVPPKGKVWRLLTGISNTTIKKMLGMASHELLEREHNFHKVSNITIKPKGSKVQSWTYVLEYKTFGSISIEEGDNFLILETDAHNSNNEFFLNYETLKTVDDMPDFVKKEYEAVSYGDVFCKNVYFWIGASEKTQNNIERQINKLNNMIYDLEGELWDSGKERSKEIKLKIKELEFIRKEQEEYLDEIYGLSISDNIKELIKLIKNNMKS